MDGITPGAFGKDLPDYKSIAEQLRQMQVRAYTTTEQLDDALTIIEYLRDVTIARSDDLDRREASVEAREAKIARDERVLKLRTRAVNAVVAPPKHRNIFGYFRK